MKNKKQITTFLYVLIVFYGLSTVAALIPVAFGLWVHDTIRVIAFGLSFLITGLMLFWFIKDLKAVKSEGITPEVAKRLRTDSIISVIIGTITLAGGSIIAYIEGGLLIGVSLAIWSLAKK